MIEKLGFDNKQQYSNTSEIARATQLKDVDENRRKTVACLNIVVDTLQAVLRKKSFIIRSEDRFHNFFPPKKNYI